MRFRIWCKGLWRQLDGELHQFSWNGEFGSIREAFESHAQEVARRLAEFPVEQQTGRVFSHSQISIEPVADPVDFPFPILGDEPVASHDADHRGSRTPRKKRANR